MVFITLDTRNLMIILTLYRMLSVNHMPSAVPRDGLPPSTHEIGPWRSDDLSPVTVQIPDTTTITGAHLPPTTCQL